MSKKAAAMNGESEPIPAFLRQPLTVVGADEPDDEPENGEVAPLTPPAEPARELTDSREAELKAIETDVLEMCAEPIKPTSIAYEIRCGQVLKVREVEGIRNGYADRRELLARRYEEAAAILDHKIADCDEALNLMLHGIGQDAPDTNHAH